MRLINGYVLCMYSSYIYIYTHTQSGPKQKNESKKIVKCEEWDFTAVYSCPMGGYKEGAARLFFKSSLSSVE